MNETVADGIGDYKLKRSGEPTGFMKRFKETPSVIFGTDPNEFERRWIAYTETYLYTLRDYIRHIFGIDEPTAFVALKVHLPNGKTTASDFCREIENARLVHGIIPEGSPEIYAADTESERPWFTMTLGEPLLGTHPLDTALAWILRLIDLCIKLRDSGYLLGDIKVDNLCLIGGRLCVIDFTALIPVPPRGAWGDRDRLALLHRRRGDVREGLRRGRGRPRTRTGPAAHLARCGRVEDEDRGRADRRRDREGRDCVRADFVRKLPLPPPVDVPAGGSRDPGLRRIRGRRGLQGARRSDQRSPSARTCVQGGVQGEVRDDKRLACVWEMGIR